jgi:membrane protein DedA with SNARE-associated domain
MVAIQDFIINGIQQNGAISVMIAGLIEQVIVPIPSPVIPMAAGFFFVPQDVVGLWPIVKNLVFKAAIPFTIGSTVGSTMVYLAAWFGGKWLIDKFSKWLEFDWEDVLAIKKKFFKGKAYDEAVIFISRAIPIVPSSLISAVAGAVRINPVSFYLFTALGLFVRGILLGWLGWQSGEALFAVSEGLDRWETIMTIGIVAVAGAVLGYGYLNRDKWLKKLHQEVEIDKD